ncbi:hypothetical protein [Micromonospora sp. WMMD710]|uniref:hypothetical protein n=1 Tax=Micromonospora sp. WMMD710 TaxID=3016085 RepID=UPI002415CCBF|nr:hypothetical protein [Micromonospora sp. WMMD710]MDG4759966.1 hypothetical protein [Micromonospora sp. WMMD710]
MLFMPKQTESDVEVIVTWRGNYRNPNGVNPKAGRVNLKADDRLEFGISSRTGEFQLNVAPGFGAFEVSDSHLLLSNFTACSTFVIENLEGGAELIKARPRRLGMVIPFEMSRILIPSDSGITELTVFAPPPTMLTPERAATAVESNMFKLDTTSKYFAVLAALCEPRLRGSSMAAVPSVHEVVERLRCTDQFREANRSSINYHVEYLADQKLPISRWAKYVDGGRMHSKREALVAFALRFDLVREEHLSLLPGVVRDEPLTESAENFAFCD